MSKFIDLTGQKFGRLTVLSRSTKNKFRKAYWECICSCPNKTLKIISADNLKSGNTKSCGCLFKGKTIQRNVKHNLYSHSLYKTWEGIIQRTTNPQHKSYKNYGARKIKIYDLWLKDLVGFIKYCKTLPNWDDPNLSIDRIDNNGNYEPGNLRFVTRSEQNSNRRLYSNTGEKYITYNELNKLYQVQKQISGRVKYFGSFKTLQKAIDCRNQLC